MPGGETPGEEKILTPFSSPRQHCYAIKFDTHMDGKRVNQASARNVAETGERLFRKDESVSHFRLGTDVNRLRTSWFNFSAQFIDHRTKNLGLRDVWSPNHLK